MLNYCATNQESCSDPNYTSLDRDANCNILFHDDGMDDGGD